MIHKGPQAACTVCNPHKCAGCGEPYTPGYSTADTPVQFCSLACERPEEFRKRGKQK